MSLYLTKIIEALQRVETEETASLAQVSRMVADTIKKTA